VSRRGLGNFMLEDCSIFSAISSALAIFPLNAKANQFSRWFTENG